MSECIPDGDAVGREQRLAIFRKTMAAYRHDQQRAYDADRRDRRKSERDAYRQEREAAGETVRRYRSTKAEPRLPGEDEEAFQRRMRRERDRERRGVKTARPYADLSLLTPVEKALHKARQAAERKRRQRERERVDAIGSLNSEELQAVSAALAELD